MDGFVDIPPWVQENYRLKRAGMEGICWLPGGQCFSIGSLDQMGAASPLRTGHFKKESGLPTIIFQGKLLVFGRVIHKINLAEIGQHLW